MFFKKVIKKRVKYFVLNHKILAKRFNLIYFSANRLDEKLLSYLDYENGFYVELGANDGIAQSNTKFFELYRNWKGILIEPYPKNFEKLKKNRKKINKFYNCACVSFDFDNDFIDLMYSNLMTIPLQGISDIKNRMHHALEGEKYGLKEKSFIFKAPVRTLQSILDEAKCPNQPDFLSLDVEGSELEVLNGINFQKTRFKYILIESRSSAELTEFMIQRGYSFVGKLSNIDYLFLDKSNRP